MDRQFTAQASDGIWLTCITKHRIDEGAVYLCAIKDVCRPGSFVYTVYS